MSDNENENSPIPKITGDINKALTQLGNVFGNVPLIGDLFIYQARRKALLGQQTTQQLSDIKKELAYYDYKTKKLIYFKDIDDPKTRIALRKEQREEKNQSEIFDYVIEELNSKGKKIEDLVIGVDTDYFKEEFIPYWERNSRYMGREDLRYLWAKILVQEMLTPHSVSIRTIEFVKILSKRDANIFNMILPYVIGGDTLPNIYNVVHSIDLQHLEHLGLLLGNRENTVGEGILFGKYVLQSEKLKYTCYMLSDIGKELYMIADVGECNFDKLEEVFDNEQYIGVGTKICYHEIVKILPTGQYECKNPPLRNYEKKEQKNNIKQVMSDLPRLSLEPNI